MPTSPKTISERDPIKLTHQEMNRETTLSMNQKRTMLMNSPMTFLKSLMLQKRKTSGLTLPNQQTMSIPALTMKIATFQTLQLLPR
jgi:hypothetical protein